MNFATLQKNLSTDINPKSVSDKKHNPNVLKQSQNKERLGASSDPFKYLSTQPPESIIWLANSQSISLQVK